MKIETSNEQLLGSTGKSAAFSIAADSKAFQILSSGIYKHKIRAIVREFSCNAYDAHLMNNSKLPWEITVPTEFNPRFTIKDYGPGLSEDSMFKVFTRYFESTKSGSEIGGFGLGAKSPFSYTDTFTVESIHDGICTIYNASMLNGFPQLFKMNESKASAGETGIKVTIPCKSADIQEWQKEIKIVLQPFSTNQYRLICPREFDFEKFEDLDDYNEDWFVGEKCYQHYSSINAICGNIVYPITGIDDLDVGWIKAKFDCIFVHFKVNEIMPQPSREQLQLDEKTVKNIKARLGEINKKLYEDDLNSLKSVAYNRHIVRKIKSMSYLCQVFLRASNIEFNGMTVDNIINSVSDMSSNYDIYNAQSYYKAYKDSPKRMRLYPIGFKTRSMAALKTYELISVDETRIDVLLLDDPAYTIKKVKESIKCLTLSGKVGEGSNIVAVYNNASGDAFLQQLKSDMLGDDVVIHKLTDCYKLFHLLPKTPKVKRGLKEKRPTAPNVIKYSISGGKATSENLNLTKSEILELSDKKWVCIYGIDGIRSIKSNQIDLYNLNIDRIVDACKFYDVDEFYAVRPSAYNHTKNFDQCLIEYISSNLEYSLINLNPEDYFTFNSDKEHSFTKRISKSNISWVVYNALGFKYSKYFIDLMTLYHNSWHAYFRNNSALNAVYEQVEKYTADCKSKHIEAVEKFKEAHPLVYYYLNDTYRRQNVPENFENDISRSLTLSRVCNV